MEALFLLIPLSLLAFGVALWIFIQMSRSGQFDDVEGQGYSILMDDDSSAPHNDAPVNPKTQKPAGA